MPTQLPDGTWAAVVHNRVSHYEVAIRDEQEKDRFMQLLVKWEGKATLTECLDAGFVCRVDGATDWLGMK